LLVGKKRLMLKRICFIWGEKMVDEFVGKKVRVSKNHRGVVISIDEYYNTLKEWAKEEGRKYKHREVDECVVPIKIEGVKGMYIINKNDYKVKGNYLVKK